MASEVGETSSLRNELEGGEKDEKMSEMRRNVETGKGLVDSLFCPECGWDDILTIEEWLKGAAVLERIVNI